MKLLNDLFTTDYGLMSITIIIMMIIGTVGGAIVMKRKINEEPVSSSRAK